MISPVSQRRRYIVTHVSRISVFDGWPSMKFERRNPARVYIFSKKGRTGLPLSDSEPLVQRLVLCRHKGEKKYQPYAVPILNVLTHYTFFLPIRLRTRQDFRSLTHILVDDTFCVSADGVQSRKKDNTSAIHTHTNLLNHAIDRTHDRTYRQNEM